MVIVTNTSKITLGDGHKLIERFNKIGKIEYFPGFLGLEVLKTERLKDHDEVVVMTRWESLDDFRKWSVSDAFKEAHKGDKGRPSYIISNKVTYYEVQVAREPIVAV